MSYQPPTKVPTEIFCRSCQGGNSPQALHCQWCGKLLAPLGQPYRVPAPAPAVRQKTGPSWFLVIGVWLVLICVLGFAVQTVIRATGGKTLTAADRSYMRTSADWSKEYSTRMSTLTNLRRNMRLGNEDWRLDVAVQGSQIKFLNRKVRAYDAPRGMGSIHKKLVQSADIYDRAMDNYIKALDTRDSSWFDRGDAEFAKAIPLITQATEELEALDD